MNIAFSLESLWDSQLLILMYVDLQLESNGFARLLAKGGCQ